MKEKMLRAARTKGWVTHKGKSITLTVDLVAETLQARKNRGPIFNILKEFSSQNFISSQTKLCKRKTNKILFKQANAEEICHHRSLQQLLKEALNMERKNQYQPQQKHTKL